jgi:molecular chaperone GrpE
MTTDPRQNGEPTTEETQDTQNVIDQEHKENGLDTNNMQNEQGVAPADTMSEGEVIEGTVEEAAEASENSAQALQQRLEQAEKEAQEYKDQWLRAVADFKNYKRRTDIERGELIKSASSSLILKLLPIIDDFERAAASVPPEIATHPWWEGTKLIEQKLRTILESEGVTAIEAEGTDFDPNWHEAVMYEEASGQDGKVTAELQKGYRLNDRVLRPSMVKVGKG